MNNIENACFDIIDERDYKYSQVQNIEFAWAWELPSKFILDNVDYQNQWLEEVTRMMCVFYSTAHVSNEENFQEWSEVRILWKAFWLHAETLWRLDINKWALVSAGPRTARDLWLISGWTLVETILEAKHSIFNKKPIVVWSNQINWSLGYLDPFVVWGPKGSGHAIALIWYDDDYEWGCFIIKNSYWDKKYDWWKMYLKYSDFELLFPSKYSLEDEIDTILLYKDKIMSEINIPMAKVAFELWIYNWKDNKLSPTREETATMILRAMQKVLNWDILKWDIETILEKYKD